MMAKILYAVNGDGLGHATRSMPIIQALSRRHDVKAIVGSRRSYDFMKGHVKNLSMFEGLRFVYEKNTVKLYDTINSNAKLMFKKSSNFRKVFNIIRRFKPDMIIVDCDYLTISVARLFNIPLVCVCNIHAFSEMTYTFPKRYAQSYYVEKILTKVFTSNIDYHVITTFFYLPVKKKNVFLYPPILRKEIIDMRPSRKDYYLVYQTTGSTSISTNNRIIRMLRGSKERFIVYGFDKEGIDGNVTYRKTNDDQFFKDFKDCKACIANGGFTFISEAVSLHKPVLSIPIKGTFEQSLNALEIKRLGYGDMCDMLTKKKLADFIKNNDRYYDNLKRYRREDNSRIIKKIENLVRELA
jgi:uncharacterized protein (TIGR00661 family)